ncbi:hypothetical protein H9Q70_013451 [Fusarium xylarioides]|nr:hypothetical protein H9Q70_013451 [Fusarium xylarioides]KAG5770091.1 hypothetical protein H9Q73_013340 [Fusarium xylarioides]
MILAQSLSLILKLSLTYGGSREKFLPAKRDRQPPLRGFEPNEIPLQLADKLLEDGERSGRPTKHTDENKDLIITKVSKDRFGREKTADEIAGELSDQGTEISATTVRSILKKEGYRKTKPTRKPGLTAAMRKERLEWCLAHQDWTLEDWKAVIWSDETSVILLQRRGGYRIWRKADERVLRSCIRERWKGSSEFMFWGAFSYDKKAEAQKAINKINAELKPLMKEKWELTNGLRRLGLRNLPGKKPEWKWKKETGKLVREGKKGGIDWWRYQQKLLIPKLLPFAKECAEERENTVVQEDKAPSHNHHIQQQVYDLHEVQRLLWCPNSPDLNAIEPAWP